MWKTYRTIVLEPNAQATVDSCAQKVSRFDDIWGGLEWLLARKPECGVIKIVSGVRYNLCVRKSDDLAKTDGIAVIYSYDESVVTIYGIKVIPYQEDA